MMSLSVIAVVVTANAYLLSAAIHFGFFFLHLRRWKQWARWSTWIAWGFHSAALIAWIVEAGRLPLFSLYESGFFFSWVVVLNYLIVELILQVRVAGTFLLPLVFVFLLYILTQPRMAVISAEVSHLLVAVHVAMALLGYGSFALAFIAAVMYVLQEQQLRYKRFSLLYQRLPSLETLDRIQYQFILLGQPFLTLAILTGALWASTVWGRFWGWEVKETWSLVTWIIYSLYLAARHWGRWGGRRAAWLAIGGFLAVMVNYFVVSSLSELHNF